jgi:group I intron endonuclease
MASDMLYVSLTRTSKKEYVNFCNISINRPRNGYIYRYSHNNISYIGCTVNVNRRKEDHKTNPTLKFGDAIKKIGYDNFEFEILETIKFVDIKELYELEDLYIQKYDSIVKGWNFRRNAKQKRVNI